MLLFLRVSRVFFFFFFFFFLGGGGGGLWEVRVTVILCVNPLVQFGSSLCASLGLVPIGGPCLRSEIAWRFNFVVEYPPPHAAIACCMRCVGSYNMGFGVFLLNFVLLAILPILWFSPRDPFLMIVRGEVCDRSKDKPVLIIVSATAGSK